MIHFQNSCLSCLKPLQASQPTCEECHYINIETKDLDERLFLMYFKYLEDQSLSIESIRRDKLSGNANFDFDVSLQFLDDPKTTGWLLSHYISKKYPDLVKSKPFAEIGFQPNAKSLNDQNIESVKKNLLDPITKQIKETFLGLDFLEEEIKSIRPYLFLPKLYDTTCAMLKLSYTFSHISDASFRERVKNHKSTDAFEIKGLKQDASRLEKLLVIKEKGFSPQLRRLAGFVYDLETAMGHIGKCELLKNLVPAGSDVLWTKLYANAIFNEKLVQLVSYKSHFPYLNRDHTKNFRNQLNLQIIAETLRTCAGKSDELDPWIYLVCEEVVINATINFDEVDTENISSEYAISSALALDKKLSDKHKKIVSTGEEYQNLNWLMGRNTDTAIKLSILSDRRLNIYQLEVFKHQLHSLTLAHRRFAFLEISEEAKADMFRHFISEENPNKRLFDRYETASRGIINGVFRLFFVISRNDYFYDQILPRLKEPFVKKMEHEHILRLIWQRKYIHLTDRLLKTINAHGEGVLSHFIAGGPTNTDKIPDGGMLHISEEAFDFLVEQCEHGALDIRPINRICTIINAYLTKYPSTPLTTLYENAIRKFTALSTFKPR